MQISRRTVLKVLSAISGSTGLQMFGISGLAANEAEWRHGLSLFGALKYPADFKHFDYVNPDAPRGGRVRISTTGSFDSLNMHSFKGEKAFLVAQTYETLLSQSFDEASSDYGLIAEAVRHADDFSSVEYRLRKEARFHDGSAITPQDVVWSMEALKAAHPQYAFYYKNVTNVEQIGDHEVRMQFSEKGNRELPLITGQLPVLPKAWWTGKTPDGKQRDINATTLEPPLGSGPYEVSDVKQGQSISVRRVEDYWGRDLPIRRGHFNFDEIVQLYFRDWTVAFEAFKADQFDWRTETTAKTWATGYDFPAINRGDIVKEEITLGAPKPMQAFVINSRREKFADARVRLALNYAFDFEWSNANLFHGSYKRTASFFPNTEMSATGLPDADELAILNEVKEQIPPEVFTAEFRNPINSNPQDNRKNLREAFRLLKEAGWKPGADRTLINAKGEPFELEFMLYSPSFERIMLPFAERLKKLGIKARVRTIDSAQYERRKQNFEFDIIASGWSPTMSPGNEQRENWGSEAADNRGSTNMVGVKDPAIDKLIDKVIYAKDRKSLVIAARALDRVLLWNHFVVPMWHLPHERIARWDRFGRPDKLPEYSTGFPSIWWWDKERAAKVKSS